MSHFDYPKLDSEFMFFLIPQPIPFDTPFTTLLSSFHFTHSSTGRKICYYGDIPYQYGDFHHAATPFKLNPHIFELKTIVNDMFRDIRFNSALINCYPTSKSTISLHSDNECEIVDNSFILTVSFGDARRLCFYNRFKKTHICNVKLVNKSVLLFSRPSQSSFLHGILSQTGSSKTIGNNMGRISITFRHIKPLP